MVGHFSATGVPTVRGSGVCSEPWSSLPQPFDKLPTSRTYARCKSCGAHRDDGASITKRGYCMDCAKKIHEQQTSDLHYHRGEYFKQWRRASAAAVGAVLVDDILERE